MQRTHGLLVLFVDCSTEHLSFLPVALHCVLRRPHVRFAREEAPIRGVDVACAHIALANVLCLSLVFHHSQVGGCAVVVVH